MIRKKTRWKRSRKKAAVAVRLFFFSRALESFAPLSRSKKRSSLAFRSWRHAMRRRTFHGCREQRTERAARSTARIKKKVQTQFEERKNVVGEREDEREERSDPDSLNFFRFDQRLSRRTSANAGCAATRAGRAAAPAISLATGEACLEMKKRAARGRSRRGRGDGEGPGKRQRMTREQESRGDRTGCLAKFVSRQGILLPPRSAARQRATPPLSAPWGPWRRVSRPWGRRRPWRARGGRRRGGREPLLLLKKEVEREGGFEEVKKKDGVSWSRGELEGEKKKLEEKQHSFPKNAFKERATKAHVCGTSVHSLSTYTRAALLCTERRTRRGKKQKDKKVSRKKPDRRPPSNERRRHRLQKLASAADERGKHLLARSPFPACRSQRPLCLETCRLRRKTRETTQQSVGRIILLLSGRRLSLNHRLFPIKSTYQTTGFPTFLLAQNVGPSRPRLQDVRGQVPRGG